MRMARTPEGAALITNPVSWAPGFQVENVFVLAGVPRVMQAMLDGLKERLSGGAPMASRSLRVELPEGLLAEGLGVLSGPATPQWRSAATRFMRTGFSAPGWS